MTLISIYLSSVGERSELSLEMSLELPKTKRPPIRIGDRSTIYSLHPTLPYTAGPESRSFALPLRWS